VWKKVWATGKWILVFAPVIAIGVSIFGGYIYHWTWTGFGPSFRLVDPNHEFVPAKTFWDWLDLLIIPIVLAVGGLWFSRAERRSEQVIAEDRAQEAALQTYLEQMSDLLVDKGLRYSVEDSVMRDVARAWTLAVLRRFKEEEKGLPIPFSYGWQNDTRLLQGPRARKGLLLRFLYEADLIKIDKKAGESIISVTGADLARADLADARLKGANLKGANLKGANLKGAFLTNANLVGANLEGAHLEFAHLEDAHLRFTDLEDADLERGGLESWLAVEEAVHTNLSGADLRRAYLMGADLEGTNLESADLGGADLGGANLRGANLRGANLGCFEGRRFLFTDLRGADLRGANLEGANLKGAAHNKLTQWPSNFDYEKETGTAPL